MIFLAVLTDSGKCFAFNAKHPKELFKPSPYLDAFSTTFGENTDSQIINITGNF